MKTIEITTRTMQAIETAVAGFAAISEAEGRCGKTNSADACADAKQFIDDMRAACTFSPDETATVRIINR